MIFATLIVSAFVINMPNARAQILPREDKQSDAGLEDIYDKFENQENQKAAKKKDEDKKEEEKKAQVDITRISELVKLSPFEDVAVIEKRFLPRTGRAEFSASGVFSTNNAFFNNMGGNIRGAFYFSEKYGIEGIYQYIASSKRPITEGLENNQHVLTTSLVEPKSNYGVMFKWVPIYGKIAWFQQKIVPFDIYFTPGIGVTQTANGSSTSFSIGTGQLFAITKSYGVRWDFNWNFYQAEVSDGTQTVSKNHSDLFLGIGFSYFFPEATYR